MFIKFGKWSMDIMLKFLLTVILRLFHDIVVPTCRHANLHLQTKLLQFLGLNGTLCFDTLYILEQFLYVDKELFIKAISCRYLYYIIICRHRIPFQSN